MKEELILVTGAATRIGRSVAVALAAEGARVASHYNSPEAEAPGRAPSIPC
jgi:NAD(P)-dependent dehydrogenase (short-subunit alcohol dehydrogenase family)